MGIVDVFYGDKADLKRPSDFNGPSTWTFDSVQGHSYVKF